MRPEIIIVGSQHYHKSFKHSDPDEQFLKSLNTLRNSLIKFQPTRICIEQEAKTQDYIDDNFNRYNPAVFYKNEAYDLGFYTAKQLNLKSVVAMDWMEQDYGFNGLSKTYDWAQNNDGLFIELIEELKAHHAKISNMNDSFNITLELNNPQNYKMDEKLYGQMMLLGDDWNTSIPWLTWWYKRNMIIVNNITRNLKDNEKVIVIVGSDHIYILKQLLEASNKFNVMTFYDWVESN